MTISYSVPETRSSNVTFGTVTSFVSSKPALSLIVTTHFSGASPSYCQVRMAEELESAMVTLSACSSTVGTVESAVLTAPVSRVSAGACRVNVYSESDSRSLMTTECPEKLTLFGSVPAVS